MSLDYPFFYRQELITDQTQLELLLLNPNMRFKVHTKYEKVKIGKKTIIKNESIEFIELIIKKGEEVELKDEEQKTMNDKEIK